MITSSVDDRIARRDQLVVVLGGQIVQTLTIDKPSLRIGRLPDNDVILNHPEVSRRHAELRRDPQGYVLTDLGSTHGTSVDGLSLLPEQPRLLIDGQEIQISPYVIVYRSGRGNWPLAAAVFDEVQSASLRSLSKPPSRIMNAGPQPLPMVMKPPKPTWPATSVWEQGTGAYLKYLPIIFHDSEFLSRFLSVFEVIWEPLEIRQDHIAMYFDPRTCPASFLPWLASWFGLDANTPWPEGRLRSLLTEITELYRWRGTKYGLTRIIELCTGAVAQITENPAEPFVFRIKVTSPEGSTLERDFIEDLILTHKPAYTGYVLEMA